MNRPIPFRSLWRYIGQGSGHGRIHQVIMTDVLEVVTVSIGTDVRCMEWSWLGSVEDFFKNFQFAGGPVIGIKRP